MRAGAVSAVSDGAAIGVVGDGGIGIDGGVEAIVAGAFVVGGTVRI